MLDFADLLDAIDPGTLVAGILAVGALMVVPRLARMGSYWIQAQIEGRNDDWEADRRQREYDAER